MILGYWLLTSMLLAVIVCLGIVARQRDKLGAERDAARAAVSAYHALQRRLDTTGHCPWCGRPR